MTGAAISINADTAQVEQRIDEIARRMGNARPAYEIIGEIVRTSILRNFEAGGRPRQWAPLSPHTLARKRGSQVLVEAGHAGGLMGSIHYEAAADHVLVGTDKVYGAIHQFGGMAGRGRKVKIPARPYLDIQDEDWTEINDALGDYLVS